MPLFKRNPNETAYTGGKKHITDVLKNSGPEGALLYRIPEEDFNSGSTLIVMPGEEAVFIHRGQVEQVFSEGSYVLSTENYPFLSRLRNAVSGGISVYNCVVVYVRTASTRQIEWGDRIAVRDPVWKIQTDLGIGGTYRVRVRDAAALIRNIFGSGSQTMTGAELNDYFASQMKARIKGNILRAIQHSGVEILGIEANLDGFSDTLQQLFVPLFEQDGLSLLSFTLDRMTILDNDVRRHLEESFGKNTAMQYMGDNWARDQFAQAIHEIAANSGSGALANTAAGLGMGMASVPLVFSMMQQMSGPAASMADMMRANVGTGASGAKTTGADRPESPEAIVSCGACGAKNSREARFCSHCGKPITHPSRCPGCGAEVSPGSRFCNRCGTRQPDAQQG